MEWMDKGIIRVIKSEYASPIVLANKKNGNKHLCVDYRRLNKKIVMDRYPLPLIDDQIDQLQNELDLKNGFFHVNVNEGSKKYTVFNTPGGHCEFNKVSFGMCTSPAIFQRIINYVFKQLSKIILVYIYYIIIPAKDEEENVKRLKMVLSSLLQSLD